MSALRGITPLVYGHVNLMAASTSTCTPGYPSIPPLASVRNPSEPRCSSATINSPEELLGHCFWDGLWGSSKPVDPVDRTIWQFLKPVLNTVVFTVSCGFGQFVDSGRPLDSSPAYR
jgi:hypothetical protein